MTLNESTYERIWALILSGELTMGERLDERVLAERLSVSRTPIREAINRLVQDRVIVREPYRGIFVMQLTPAEVSDVYVVRMELEGLAMRLALPRMSDLDLEHSVGLVRAADQALKENDLLAYGEYDRQLHEFIIEKSANASLQNVLASLSREIQLVRAYGNRQPHVADDAAVDRHSLLDAMLRRDADAAAAALEEHIEDVRIAVVANLTESLVTASVEAVTK